MSHESWVATEFGVRLNTAAAPVGLVLPELVELALRRNPRRAHLLVSTVLGKHLPVDPRVVRQMGHLLGSQVRAALGDRPAADIAVFGFAETATGLGHCVAETLNASWYLHSTRRDSAVVPVSARFEEGHSHATDHQVQPDPPELLDSGAVLVVVDDEFSTGATAMGAIAELHRLHPRQHYVVAALIDLRGSADIAAMKTFAAGLGADIDVVALASGTVELPTGLAAAASAHIEQHPGPARPTAEAAFARVDIEWPADVPVGGRHGFRAADYAAFDAAVDVAVPQIVATLPAEARRILVIGAEELMFLPLRLAVGIAELPGYEARYQTTTRSPVHAEDVPGYPVRRAFTFASSEPAATEPRYLYNADWRPDDREVSAAEADALVIVIDNEMDGPVLLSPNGLLAALSALNVPLVLAVIA